MALVRSPDPLATLTSLAIMAGSYRGGERVFSSSPHVSASGLLSLEERRTVSILHTRFVTELKLCARSTTKKKRISVFIFIYLSVSYYTNLKTTRRLKNWTLILSLRVTAKTNLKVSKGMYPRARVRRRSDMKFTGQHEAIIILDLFVKLLSVLRR